jgi:hypothetical protein
VGATVVGSTVGTTTGGSTVGTTTGGEVIAVILPVAVASLITLLATSDEDGITSSATLSTVVVTTGAILTATLAEGVSATA